MTDLLDCTTHGRIVSRAASQSAHSAVWLLSLAAKIAEPFEDTIRAIPKDAALYWPQQAAPTSTTTALVMGIVIFVSAAHVIMVQKAQVAGKAT